MTEFQAGFWKGYSSVDNVFNLTMIWNFNLHIKQINLCIFDWLSAEFDTVDRNALFYKLSSTGVSTRIVGALQALYDDTLSGMGHKGRVTDCF